jgi:hypothetical protein
MIKTAAIDLGRMPAFADGCMEHGITDIKYILKLEGGIYKEDNSVFYPLPFASPVPGESVSIIADRESIFVNVGSTDRSAFIGIARISYTSEET